MKSFYATTPIYYVNDLPHIGHSYTTIACDISARWKDLAGKDVFFLTGTDEHGLKISQAAELKNMPEQEFVDGIVTHYKELWRVLSITNNDFIRTTQARHYKAVQNFFEALYKKDEIYKGSYKGLYCVPCETYFTAAQSENNVCPDCSRELKEVEEESYFFRLSKYTGFLLDYYKNNPEFLKPKERANEIISFVRDGLRDLSVSRIKVKWGIPVPFDSKHTVYVWFDALINYLTAAGFPDDRRKLTELWPCDVHFVGKEIFKFHAVIWPAMLKAYGLELPKTVFAHGWWTHNGDKMSKSKGNVVNPLEFCAKYGADPLRYFLFREISFGSDGDFSEEAFLRRYNYDLANDLGNLVSRVMNMLEKFMPSGIKPGHYSIAGLPMPDLTGKLKQIYAYYEEYSFQAALNSIWEIIVFANRYIEENAPWALAKNNDAKLPAVMLNLYLMLKIIAILIYPVMPASSKSIMEALRDEAGIKPGCKQIFEQGVLSVTGGTGPLSKIKPIFPRK